MQRHVVYLTIVARSEERVVALSSSIVEGWRRYLHLTRLGDLFDLWPLWPKCRRLL